MQYLMQHALHCSGGYGGAVREDTGYDYLHGFCCSFYLRRHIPQTFEERIYEDFGLALW